MGVVAIQTSYLRSIQIGYVLFLVSCVRSLSIDRTLCRLESFFGGVVNNSSNKRKEAPAAKAPAGKQAKGASGKQVIAAPKKGSAKGTKKK